MAFFNSRKHFFKSGVLFAPFSGWTGAGRPGSGGGDRLAGGGHGGGTESRGGSLPVPCGETAHTTLHLINSNIIIICSYFKAFFQFTDCHIAHTTLHLTNKTLYTRFSFFFSIHGFSNCLTNISINNKLIILVESLIVKNEMNDN